MTTERHATMNETGRARVLTYGDLRSELMKGNEEILLVLAAALNPAMFDAKVKIHEPSNTRYSNYAVFEVVDSGNAYALSFDTIILHAAQLYCATGKKTEVLRATATEKKTDFYIS
jgi:hypothetical protein